VDAEAWKHIVAILAAVAAVVVSFGQAKNAKKKSGTQEDKYKELVAQADSPSSQVHITLRGVLADDVDHFSRVGTWWYVGLGGALATLLAEIIDTQLS
jgi:hypothetical protein